MAPARSFAAAHRAAASMGLPRSRSRFACCIDSRVSCSALSGFGPDAADTLPRGGRAPGRGALESGSRRTSRGAGAAAVLAEDAVADSPKAPCAPAEATRNASSSLCSPASASTSEPVWPAATYSGAWLSASGMSSGASPSLAAARRRRHRDLHSSMPAAGATSRALSHSPISAMQLQYPSILPAMRCMFAACFMASARLCAARPRPLMARAFDSAMLARLSNTGTAVAECMHSDASDTGRSAASLPPATTLARASKGSSNPTGDRNSRMSDAIAATPSTDGDLPSDSTPLATCASARISLLTAPESAGGADSLASTSAASATTGTLNMAHSGIVGTSQVVFHRRTVVSRLHDAIVNGLLGCVAMPYTSARCSLLTVMQAPVRRSQLRIVASQLPV
mmetsp:Transcript_6350/g.16434  ORF Transcript_6350/g.16434 Transcript_6350/m.16434 type:complete len:396 (+) Transcript_6350:1171-2358(+)